MKDTAEGAIAVNKWKRRFPVFVHDWKENFEILYKTIVDNKLKEFSFKVMLVQFKIKKNARCQMKRNSMETSLALNGIRIHYLGNCAAQISFY